MPSFHEVQFPNDISYGSSGGPEYSTDVVITNSGFEKRNINWSESKAVYNISHGVKTNEQLENLIAFFRARMGRAYGFRFKDWSDYKAMSQNIAIGDGVKTHFQLVKTYISGNETVTRIIRKPSSQNFKLYFDGAEQIAGFNMDETTGLIEFNVAPSNNVVISVDFEFDVPVRFDTDRLSASLDSYGLNSWNNISIVEIKV